MRWGSCCMTRQESGSRSGFRIIPDASWIEARTCTPQRRGLSREERADVFALAGGHHDVEARFGGDIKVAARLNLCLGVLAIQLHPTGPSNDLHAFRSVGPEVKGSRENNSKGLPGSIREPDSVTNDPAIKIHVGLGDHRHPAEFCSNRHPRRIGESHTGIQATSASQNRPQRQGIGDLRRVGS